MDLDPALAWRTVSDDAFNSHIGPIRFARTGENRWQSRLELQPHHMNLGGVCHGGVYMTLSDTTMGIAAHEASQGKRSATIDYQSHFLAAAKLGQTLVCTARANRVVSGLAFMECELEAGGRLCMRASGIWKALTSPKPRAGDGQV
ncbi:MAG: PaaI family thioesterase [Pseudomonadota bacterium]